MRSPGNDDVHERIRAFWDRDSATYDRSAEHAVADPVDAAAWRQALHDALPPPPARVLDIGAGTGALSLLAAELGHDVTAVDMSEGMLTRAKEKASARGLEVHFAVGSASEPPPGPFDAVIERHVVWTLPDPAETLAAWRRVVSSGGRLVLFEGIFGRTDAISRLQVVTASLARRAMRVPDHHHAPYPEDVLARLPLASLPSPEPLVAFLYEAGWRAVRLRRLRDVEWAARLRARWPLGALEHVRRYMLTADA
jgi:ubiquinone/menaquinone biosynthesis C-methylase UbiE